MKIALASVCPGGRETRWLGRVRGSWEAYARRHGMRVHVVTRHPCPSAPYWGKYFVLDQPELAGCDAALVLDNDVVTSPDAPLPSEGWDGKRVRIADERAQFPYAPESFACYYQRFSLEPPEASFLVLNTGVMLYTREHTAWFRIVFQDWLEWRKRFRPGDSPVSANIAHDLSTHDQPHVSRALQIEKKFELLDRRFNRVWGAWWENGGRSSSLPLLLYAKTVELCSRGLPSAAVNLLAAPGHHWWREALRDSHFVHVAGSKSPLALLPPVL